MNRAWALGVGFAILIGLTVVVLARPGHVQPSPEARAMRQLRDASIRPTQVRYLRSSPDDPTVMCGLLVVQDPRSQSGDVLFVSTPQRVVVGRVDNPSLQRALNQYCRGTFPTPLTSPQDR